MKRSTKKTFAPLCTEALARVSGGHRHQVIDALRPPTETQIRHLAAGYPHLKHIHGVQF